MRRFVARLLNLFRSATAEREMTRDIESQLALIRENFERRGLSPEEARLAALRAYGGVELAKEWQREARSFLWMEQFFRDIRLAGRNLQRDPGFSILVVLIVALGIGANTAVFSVVNAVLLKPLPFHDPDRLVTLTSIWKDTGRQFSKVTLPDFVDWRASSTVFANMAYYRKSQRPVTADGSAHYAQVLRVSPNFFETLAVTPMMGRVFTTEDENGERNIVVVSHEYWRSRLNGSADVLYKTLRIDGRSFIIVGVSAPGFSFPDATEIWRISDVVNQETLEPRGSLNYFVMARLRPGATSDQAQAEVGGVSDRLQRQYPISNQGRGVIVKRMRDELTGNVRLTLLLLLGAVGLVLLIACSNIATLLLARATARTHEIAMRAALGASRGRIVRQLLAECLLFAILAGIAGLVTAVFASKALVAIAPADIPRLSEVGVDAQVLLFSLGISVLASILFGMAPAVYASRVDLNDAFKQGSSRTVVSGGTGRMRQVLVIGEIALSIMLLTGAGLLIRSFVALNNVPLGFRPERVLVMETSVPARSVQATRFFRELLGEISSVPGVLAIGATMGIPGHVESSGSFSIGDHLEVSALNPFSSVFSVVTPGTFAVLQVPIKQGRDFNEADRAGAPLTAIINETLAQIAFHGRDPIGRTIFAGFDSEKPMTIVGVAGDIRQSRLDKPPSPEIFMPYEQHTEGAGTSLRVIVKTQAAPEALENTLRQMVRERSADVPVKFTTMERSIQADIGSPRFRTLLIGGFASIALCLAIAGVYGVLAYSVGQRSSEIGLRMALGATTRDILWMIARQGLTLAGIGIIFGLAGSLAASQFLTSMLFQVKPNDAATYLAVVGSLGIATACACYLPASRAARLDPLVSLRRE